MSGELVRWLATTPAQREHHEALTRIDQTTDRAQARVQAVGHVAQTAMLEALSVAMTKREAALLVPEDAAKFDLIATHAAIGMAAEIQRISGT